MSVLRRAKLRTPDGTESIEYPLGVEAKNVEVANQENLSQRLVRIDEDLEKNEEDIAAVSELAGRNKQNIGANEIRIDALERRSASVDKKPYYYNTVADMKADTKLKANDLIKTLGYYSINDKGGAYYYIRNKVNNDVIDEKFIIAISNNNLVAELIYNNILNIKQLGYINDIGLLTDAFSKNIEYLEIPDGTFHIKAGTYSKLYLKGTKNTNLVFDGMIVVNDLKLENLNVQANGITRMIKPNGSDAKIEINNISVNSSVNYFIYVGSDESSSVTISKLIVKNSNFENLSESPFRLICSGSTIRMENNNFKNIGTSIATRTSCLQAGNPVNWDTMYFEDVIIKNNICYNLTSANSTGDDSSECQAFKLSIKNGIIENNKIENILGTGADHEGIYIKGKKAQINNNILIDCGEGDGAITTKPVEILNCSGNIIKTHGNGALIRSTQGIFSNNTIDVINTNNSTFIAIDIGDSNSTKLEILNNNININDSGICCYLRYIAGTFIGNVINGENITNCFGLQNEISGKQIIKNNIFNLKNSQLCKVNSVTTGFEVLFLDNLFNLDNCINLLQYTSGTNKIIFNFENNKFNMKNNTSGTIFASSGANSNSIFKFIKNVINLNGGTVSRIFYDYNKELYVLNNTIKNGNISYFCSLTSVSKDITEIENNNILSDSILRMEKASSCTLLKIINNFIFENSYTFTTNDLTVNNAYLINNTFKSGDFTSHIVATNLINYNNSSYVS